MGTLLANNLVRQTMWRDIIHLRKELEMHYVYSAVRSFDSGSATRLHSHTWHWYGKPNIVQQFPSSTHSTLIFRYICRCARINALCRIRKIDGKRMNPHANASMRAPRYKFDSLNRLDTYHHCNNENGCSKSTNCNVSIMQSDRCSFGNDGTEAGLPKWSRVCRCHIVR